ncbi:MAG: DNA-binding beta-propeller fold protein YncE [Gammaproteobacteria bacterium]|jgi:DNA-binding beta-propeller fold protein YncE
MKESNSLQLMFQLNNVKATDTIYITSDESVNKLTLKITSTESCNFSPGKLVPPAQAGSEKGSILYLNLSSLNIPDDKFNDITCKADNWDYKIYPDGIIGMTPTTDITLDSGTGNSIDIKIDKVTVQSPPAPNANLNVQGYRVPPVSSGELPSVSFFKVSLVAAPEGHSDLHDSIACNLTSLNSIIASADPYPNVSNSISFAFQPGASPTVVKAGPDTKFTVSFVYASAAPGYGALTTFTEAATNIKVKQGLNASAWVITANPAHENPTWTLQPPNGDPIIGSGGESLVEFDINNIITTFQPGPTLIMVQYEGITGYDAGSYIILLEKVGHSIINSLTIDPNPSVLTDGEAEIEISWDAENYESLILEPFHEDVTHVTKYKGKIKKSIEIALYAQGAGSSENVAIKTVLADVLPVINGFNIFPNSIYYNDFPFKVNMFWKVNTNDNVLLLNDNTGSKEIYPASNNIPKDVQEPGMWSIIPVEDESLKRDSLVQAFKMDSNLQQLTNNSSRISASPVAEFVATVGTSSNTVAIVNTLTGDNYVKPITVGTNPLDVVFSDDGAFLVTANEDKTISIISVTYNSATANYDFGTAKSVTLDTAPNRIAITDDATYIFASTNGSGNTGNLIVLKNDGSGTFSVDTTVDVGAAPEGIAIGLGAVQLYVANSGSNSISTLGFNPVSKKYEFVYDISDVGSKPVDVGLGGSNRRLLLAVSQDDNKVIVMDLHTQGAEPHQEISVGTTPAGIVMGNSGAYAFVCNSGDNTVALIGCSEGVGNCKVLEAAKPVGTKPLGITLSTDGYVVFVANSGEKSFTRLNLVNYQMIKQPKKVASSPNSTSTSLDGSSVAIWHNPFAFTDRSGTQAKGITVLETSSGTTSTKFTNDKVVNIIYHPDSNANKAFAIMQDKNQIAIIDTTNFSIALDKPIPDSSDGLQNNPVDMVLSKDGTLLFVLAQDSSFNVSMIVYSVDVSTNTYTEQSLLKIYTAKGGAKMTVTPDGNHVYIAVINQNKIYIANSKGSGSYDISATILSFSYFLVDWVASPDSSYIYLTGSQTDNLYISVIDVEKSVLKDFLLPNSYNGIVDPQGLNITPDGTRLLMTDSIISGIRIISTRSLRIVQTLSWSSRLQYPVGIAITANGSKIFLAAYNSSNVAQITQIGASGNEIIDTHHVELFAETDAFTGLFLRDFVGETPGGSTSGKSYTNSPDIIVNEDNIIPTAELINQTNYDAGTPSYNAQLPQQMNNAYVRGINESSGALKSWVYLYYIDANVMLWPQKWYTDGVTFGGIETQYWAPLEAATSKQIVTPDSPFIWTPKASGTHYCLIAWTVDQENKTGEEDKPDLFHIGQVADMAKFIFDHPNVSWRNTSRQPGELPILQNSSNIDSGTGGGYMNVGIQLNNIPVECEIEFQVPGPNAQNTINYEKKPVPNPNSAPTQRVLYPEGFQTTLTWKLYNPNKVPLPEGANIIPIIGTRDSLDLIDFALLHRPQHILHVQSYNSSEEMNHPEALAVPPSPMFIVGSYIFNLDTSTTVKDDVIIEDTDVGTGNDTSFDTEGEPVLQDCSDFDVEDEGFVNVGVQLRDIPKGCVIEFQVLGSNPQNTINYKKTIVNPNATFTQRVKYPAGFKSKICFKLYNPKGVVIPDGASIIPVIQTPIESDDLSNDSSSETHQDS